MDFKQLRSVSGVFLCVQICAQPENRHDGSFARGRFFDDRLATQLAGFFLLCFNQQLFTYLREFGCYYCIGGMDIFVCDDIDIGRDD